MFHPPTPTPPKKFENFYSASWHITAFSSITGLWPSLRKFWLLDTRQPPRHVTGNQKPFDFVFSPWSHGFLWSTFSNRGLSVLSPSLRLYSLNALSIFLQESSRFGQQVHKSQMRDRCLDVDRYSYSVHSTSSRIRPRWPVFDTRRGVSRPVPVPTRLPIQKSSLPEGQAKLWPSPSILWIKYAP